RIEDFFFFNDTATTEIYTLSLHELFRSRTAASTRSARRCCWHPSPASCDGRSEEHTSELQSLAYLVCRLLLEKKKLYRSPLECYQISDRWRMSCASIGKTISSSSLLIIFFFNDTATTEIYTLSLHDALPISVSRRRLVTSTRLAALPGSSGRT